MDVSTVIETIGSRGKYHYVVGTLLAITMMNLAINNLSPVVLGYLPPHRCSSIGNSQSISRSTNQTGNSTWTEYGQCFEMKHNNKSVTKIPCQNGWNFELEEKQSTIMNEFSLVCDKEYLGLLSVSIYFCGVMIGVIICGLLSDRFGRRKVIIMTMFGQIIVGIALSFSPNYTSFAILRFALGFFMEGLPNTSFVMLMEMMPSKIRTHFAGLYEISWPIGSVLMASISWAVKDWRKIQLAFSLISIYAVVYFWILPESIRWSVAKGRLKEAIRYAARIAKFNKVSLPEDFTIAPITPEKEEESNSEGNVIRRVLRILTKTKVIRKRAICMFHIWMTASFLYYGISLNVASLSGNIYKNLFISNVIEIPAVVIAIILFARIGRRSPLIVYFFVAGVALIISGCLPDKANDGTDLRTHANVLAFIGKFCVTAAFSNLAIFTSELFPTAIRSTISGSCAFFNRIGSIIAPQVIVLGKYTAKELPFVFIGSLALIASFAAWVLPETKGRLLPNTIEDVEEGRMKLEIDMNIISKEAAEKET